MNPLFLKLTQLSDNTLCYVNLNHILVIHNNDNKSGALLYLGDRRLSPMKVKESAEEILEKLQQYGHNAIREF